MLEGLPAMLYAGPVEEQTMERTLVPQLEAVSPPVF